MNSDSNSADENSMLDISMREIQYETIDHYLLSLEKNEQIARYDLKQTFLKKLKKQLQEGEIEINSMELLDQILPTYISEQQIHSQNIIETTILKFSVFQQFIPRDRSYNDKPLFTEFKIQDWEYFEAVLKSNILDQYLILIIRLKKEQNLKAQPDSIRMDCLNYFKKTSFLRINHSLIVWYNIIGYCLHSKQLIISNFYSDHPKIEILLLIHMYFQREFKLYGFIYQKSKMHSIIDFESEIFPIKFNSKWLTVSRLEYVEKSANWAQLSSVFVTQLNEREPLRYPRQVNPIIKTNFHNYLQSTTISWIKQFLNDLAFETIDTMQLKYHYLSTHTQTPQLTSSYTNLQYFLTVKCLMIKSVRNYNRLIELKNYNTIANPQIQTIFDYLINSTDYNKISLIQQLFLWMFQCEFDSKVEHCGNMCLQIIPQHINQRKLSDNDHELLQIIVNSEGVRRIVMKINSIDGKFTSVEDLEQEYQHLNHFLKNILILTFKIKSLIGISLMNGRIGLDRDVLEKMDVKQRALRMITLVHEAYCHKKRKDYVSPRNILELTPENLNAQQNRVRQEQNRKKGGECGYYLEEYIHKSQNFNINNFMTLAQCQDFKEEDLKSDDYDDLKQSALKLQNMNEEGMIDVRQIQSEQTITPKNINPSQQLIQQDQLNMRTYDIRGDECKVEFHFLTCIISKQSLLTFV